MMLPAISSAATAVILGGSSSHPPARLYASRMCVQMFGVLQAALTEERRTVELGITAALKKYCGMQRQQEVDGAAGMQRESRRKTKHDQFTQKKPPLLGWYGAVERQDGVWDGGQISFFRKEKTEKSGELVHYNAKGKQKRKSGGIRDTSFLRVGLKGMPWESDMAEPDP
ncbi:hypothetical protein AAES_02922 [Amazona aestiva]|uniref:Uncharacterized protein n=1 Tax=Amazona aestiva TaxID=12930 RepID=A0A0Q3XBG3_AMAAE|nr:hypothetical protein AAES_02922 [Amazona aestiva]